MSTSRRRTPTPGRGRATHSHIADSDDKVERRLDELYRGAPEDFTAGRNELAAELKAAGEAEVAADVKRQKRPTQAASVVNRLSLDHSDETQALLDAAERLRDVHSQLGTAGSGERLREAARLERQALERLMEIAREMDPRPSAATLDRVGETLQAAGSDEEVARLVRTGRLDRERRAAGLPGEATPTRSRAATKPAKDRSQELKEARAALKELRPSRDAHTDGPGEGSAEACGRRVQAGGGAGGRHRDRGRARLDRRRDRRPGATASASGGLARSVRRAADEVPEAAVGGVDVEDAGPAVVDVAERVRQPGRDRRERPGTAGMD